METVKELKKLGLTPKEILVYRAGSTILNLIAKSLEMSEGVKNTIAELKKLWEKEKPLRKIIKNLTPYQREFLLYLSVQKSSSKATCNFHHSTTRSLYNKGIVTLINYDNGEFYQLTDLGYSLIALIKNSTSL